MTVQAQATAVGYMGNGVTLIFAYTFRILDAAFLKVYFDDVLQVGGYTVDGVGNQLGGNVTFAVAPANGVHVRLQRFTAKTQDTDYTPYDAFPAETHETALDKLTMLVQEGIADAGNAIKVPADEAVNTILPAAATRQGQFVSFDAGGNVIVGQPIGVPATPFMQTLLDDTTAAQARGTLGVAALPEPTAKGDIIAATGANAWSKFAAGTNDFALLADSGQAAGVKWASVFNDSSEVDVATSATPAIFATGKSVVRITGGTGANSITGFDAGALGKTRVVRMQNNGNTLYAGANLLLPTIADKVQLMAGDYFIAEALGGGVTRVHAIVRASGEVLRGGFVPFGMFMHGCINAPASATNYLQTGPGGVVTATEHYAVLVVPEACTISELRMWASAALAGGTAAITVRKNLADTALTCTLAAASGQVASDVTHSFDAEEGDIISVKIVTGAIGATTDFGVSYAIKKKGLQVGVGTHFSINSGANAVTSGSILSTHVVTTEAHAELAIPPCRIQSRACYMGSGATVGSIYGAGIRKNGANDHSGGAAGSLNMSPLTHVQATASGEVMNPGGRGPIFQFAEGDLWNQRGVTADADAVNIRHSNEPLGPTDQHYHHNLIRLQCGNQLQALTRYAAAWLGNGAGVTIDAQSATETDVQVPMPACILRGLRVVSNTVVAGGQNCVITIRKNGVDQTLTCTLTNASRLASDLVNAVAFAAGDLLSIKVVSSATAGTHHYNITVEVNLP